MLKFPPTQKHLARMYYELARFGARAVGGKAAWPYRIADEASAVVLAVEMSRYDPRLFGIAVEHVLARWRDLPAQKIRGLMSGMECPQALLVVYNFAKSAAGTDRELGYLYDYLSRGYAGVAPQLYFKGLYAPAGSNMFRAASEGIAEFSEWGFLARERPVLHGAERKTVGRWSGESRQNVIRRLVSRQKRVTISEYLEALDHTVSRQQALADLKSASGIRMSGKGRGAAWVASGAGL